MAGLAKVRVRALGVETRQQQLQQVLRPNLEQARQLAREARACRAMGGGCVARNYITYTSHISTMIANSL